jgi:hypothetical protein
LGCGDDENQTSAVGAGGFAAGGSGGTASGAGCEDPIPTTACDQWLCVSGDYVCVDNLPPEEHPLGCVYEGFFYQVNATFDAVDGCNSCECAATGQVTCTDAACDAGTALDAGLDGGVTPVDGGDASVVDTSLSDADSDATGDL